MKRRDVILDFTTLLDVALILLFFFILFSNVQVTDATAAAEQKQQEAESLMADAKDMQEQAGKELEHIKEAEDRDGENIEGILEFDRGLNVKFILEVEDENNWQLRVYKGQDKLGDIHCKDNVAIDLMELMDNAGYGAKDTLICDYIYDASKPGSLAAYRSMADVIEEVRQRYEYFYYSETDISVLED